MIGRDVLFYLPYAAFLLILLIPLFYGQFSLQRYRQRLQKAYTSSSLLPHLLVPRSFGVYLTKSIGWALIWILSCFALMQPFGNIRYSPGEDNSMSRAESLLIPQEVLFVVDTSPSMRVADGLNGETRLNEAKNIMEDVVRQIHGETVSLYSFASELKTIVPPTLDYIFVRLSIKDLEINQEDVDGTRLAAILGSLKNQVFDGQLNKHYTVFLLSDGGDTQLESLKGAEKERETQKILNAISHPKSHHLHLYTIGIGALQPQTVPHVTSNGKPVYSKLEPDILKELAAKERGKYYAAHDWSSWSLAKELVNQIKTNALDPSLDAQMEREVIPITNEDIVVDLYFQIPLGIGILFYFLITLLPDKVTVKRTLPLIFIAASSTLWSQDFELISRQAENLRAAHDYTQASHLYESLLSRTLPQWQKARLLYNLGTLRLSQQRPSEAISYFQKINPNDLSLPNFGRDLFLNIGIAYLQHANQMESPSWLSEQAIFIKQALQAFVQAQTLECHLQETEESQAIPCKKNALIDRWKEFSQLQLKLNEKKKHEEIANKGSDASTEDTPVSILERALKQAHSSLQASYSAIMMSQASSNKTDIRSLLTMQQQVFVQSTLFIPAVIKEQKYFFQHSTDFSSQCQQTPWDQVIPLFDSGYQSARDAEKSLKSSSSHLPQITTMQEQTVKDWEKALDLLKHPPSQEQESSSASQNLINTFQYIQEMYQQDQSSEQKKQEELHSW